MRTVSQELLHRFKEEIWKDRRILRMVERRGQRLLVKHCSSHRAANEEGNLLRFLGAELGAERVPYVDDVDGSQVRLRYIEGIRVFNFLVALDNVPCAVRARAREIQDSLIWRCERNQMALQAALVRYKQPGCRQYEFGEKIISIVRMLAELLKIPADMSKIERELAHAEAVWRGGATVPFRDANPKNMVLCDASLALSRFSSEEARMKYIGWEIGRDRASRWKVVPIVDFDFSSSKELTTPEDDVISFKYHDRTWRGAPMSPADVVWGYPADACRCVLTFVLRYYRYGGRRAIYRLVHPSAHAIRHRHDQDRFYFERLLSIAPTLWPQITGLLPRLMSFTMNVARGLRDGRPVVDLFVGSDEFESRPHYGDMFPY